LTITNLLSFIIKIRKLVLYCKHNDIELALSNY